MASERHKTGDVEGVADERNLEDGVEVLASEVGAVEPELEEAEQRPLQSQSGGAGRRTVPAS